MGYDIRQFAPGSDFYQGEPGLPVIPEAVPLDNDRDVMIRTHSTSMHVRVCPSGGSYRYGVNMHFGSHSPVSQGGDADDLRELSAAFHFLAQKLDQE